MPVPQWLIEGWLPAGGLTFLHGPTSIGKSPLTWAVAQAVTSGIPFFGHAVLTKGPVLYIELDTPDQSIQPRLKFLNPAPEDFWLLNLQPGIDIRAGQTSETYAHLFNANATVKPILVIVNTLRKSHQGDDKSSEIPNQVYQALHKFFPHAAKLMVHHDRKANRDSTVIEDPDQAFSGSQAWVNDAQVAWHLRSTDKKARKVTLEMTKSQVSALAEPLHLQLQEDGTNWTLQTHALIVAAFKSLDPTQGLMIRYEGVAKRIGVSVSTVQRALKEAGI